MGLKGEHTLYKEFLLVGWARRAGTRDFCPFLTAVVGPVQSIYFITIITIHYFN
jgi:hypothetical protein